MDARSGFVVIDFRDCSSLPELFEMYQDFGVLCARCEVLGCNARVFRVEGEAAHWLRLQNNYDPDPELEEFSHPRRSSSAMIAAAPSAGVPRSPGISSSGDNGAS